jgi:proteasome component ECM29
LAFGELCFTGAAKLIDGERLKTILERLKSLVTNDQLKSNAIQTIGLFSLLLDESSEELDSILETLFSLYDQKDITLQFSIAESLAAATAGYDCSFLHSRFDIDLPQTLSVSRRTTLPRIVSEVLTKARNPKPSLKKAACVWSLALLEYCGKLPEIMSQLTEFHRVFRSNLSDREGTWSSR